MRGNIDLQHVELMQASGSCSNAERAGHGSSVTHAAQKHRRRQSRPTRQRQRSALVCARFRITGCTFAVSMRATDRQRQCSCAFEVYLLTSTQARLGPVTKARPLYATAIPRPEDVQPGEAITAADASSNGAPAAAGSTPGDSSAELPAGELKWDPPGGMYTARSDVRVVPNI